MIMINIKNILYIWNIHYDIVSKSCIETITICNIGKDNCFFMCYRRFVFIRYRKDYLCPYCIWPLFLYIIYTKHLYV